MNVYNGAELDDAGARYWLAIDAWTREEAAYLLHAIDPRKLKDWAVASGGKVEVEFPVAFNALAHMVAAAFESGAIAPPAVPKEVIRWAKSKGLRLPRQLLEFGHSQPIDWPFWSKLQEVKVFEALALLDNQAPSAGPPDPEDTSPEYRMRLRLLLDAMSDRRQFMPGTLNIGDPQLHGVRLVQVGAWAISNAVALPDRFPRPPQRREPPPPIKTVSDHYAPPAGARPANWEKWKHIPNCELWRAVCLTFDVEPDAEVLGMRHWLQNRRDTPRGLPEAFPDRLDIAQANVSTNGPIRPHRLYAGVLRNPHAEVSLAEVAAAGIQWGWTMPDVMRALAGVAAPQGPGPRPETSRKATATLSDSEDPPTPNHVKGLTTPDIAQCFDGVMDWTADRWTKNLSAAKWAESARIARGEQGGASALWNPLVLAQLIHGRAKDKGAKAKLAKALLSLFKRLPTLAPWRDDFADYFATHCADD